MVAFVAAAIGADVVSNGKMALRSSGLGPSDDSRNDVTNLVHSLAKMKGGSSVRYTRIRAQRESTGSRYTHLSACVREEEEGGFTVQVRLYHEAKPENGVWGEEIADSIETASALLDDLAAAYSIPQTHIKIRVRMENSKDGTLH